MDKLLIIADDFTGALDTGIQFTKMGIRARIVTAYDYDMTLLKANDSLLSANTDTRPLSPEAAYHRVYTLAVNAKKAGFTNAYKKTDSGLRGNVGIELKAAMDAYEQKVIAFVPALPRLNRVTVDGIAYIDGVPVAESVFGRDPFEPVTESDIEKIIHQTADVNVVKVPKAAYDTVSFDYEEETILLFDAETEEDLFAIAGILKSHTKTILTAGCAGFAAAYQDMLDFEVGQAHAMQKSDGLLVLCGSVNQITVRQLAYAEAQGFTRVPLSNERKLGDYGTEEEAKAFFDQLYQDITKTDCYLIDTLGRPGEESVIDFAAKQGKNLDDIRFMIAGSLGRIAMEMVNRGLNYTFSMTGGDTLMGFMKCIGVKELVPICEIGKGAVLAAMRWNGKRIQVISKSGGFGEEDIFVQMLHVVVDPAR